ncbi:MAG: rhomboid family intramembrane serine protease [Planctomycetota bacterium]|nr:MAG: rhomboid family intramembrane serine protease [Planctomycetota bacterium]
MAERGPGPVAAPEEVAAGVPPAPTPEAAPALVPPKRRAALPVATWTFAIVLLALHALLVVSLRHDGRPARVGWGALPAPVLWALGAASPEALAPGGHWRLFASVLLHQGLVHLFLNVYALVLIGRSLERLAGTIATAAVLLASGMAGAWASAWAGELTVGASGAVLGLLGALVALVGRSPALRWNLGRLVALSLLLLGGGLAFNAWLAPRFGARISNAAHLGGWIAGALLGLVLPVPGGSSRAGFGRRVLAGLALLGVFGVATVLGRETWRHWKAIATRETDAFEAALSGRRLERHTLEALGLSLALPHDWGVIERGPHYVAFGPDRDRPYVQIIEGEVRGVGSGWWVPEVIVRDLQRRHPDLVASAPERRQLAGREAVRFAMAYRQPGAGELRQVRYVVRHGARAWQLVLLAPEPLAEPLEKAVVPTIAWVDGDARDGAEEESR